jgi:hypothetical protein
MGILFPKKTLENPESHALLTLSILRLVIGYFGHFETSYWIF